MHWYLELWQLKKKKNEIKNPTFQKKSHQNNLNNIRQSKPSINRKKTQNYNNRITDTHKIGEKGIKTSPATHKTSNQTKQKGSSEDGIPGSLRSLCVSCKIIEKLQIINAK